MKVITVVNNSSKKISYLLNNLMDYEIDKEDHILRLHRIVDGDDIWDNVKLKKERIRSETWVGYFHMIYKVEELIEEFLADDDAYVLDISEYVDQDVMMRDDESESEAIYGKACGAVSKNFSLKVMDEA